MRKGCKRQKGFKFTVLTGYWQRHISRQAGSAFDILYSTSCLAFNYCRWMWRYSFTLRHYIAMETCKLLHCITGAIYAIGQAGLRAGDAASTGGQVTLCDPIWHAGSRSSAGASSTNCYTALLSYYPTSCVKAQKETAVANSNQWPRLIRPSFTTCTGIK